MVIAGLALIGATGAAGAAPPHEAKAKSTTTTAPKVTGTITISAAASLTSAFTKIGTDFQKANPGTTVTFNFGGSGTLVTQIQSGATADVFASADGANMQK